MSLLSESFSTVIEASQVIAQPVVFGMVNNGSDVYISNAVYDFAVNGASIAAPIVLPLSQKIPQNAIVYGVLFDISVALVGGVGTTLQFIINAQSFTSALSAAPWSAGANPVQVDQSWKLSADVESVSLKFAVANGTAGAMNISVLYIL
jgi:hypothetical protein